MNETEKIEAKIKKITNYEIRFISEFKNLYRLALNNKKSMANSIKDPEFIENSHLIVNFLLKDMQKTEDLKYFIEGFINFI